MTKRKIEYGISLSLSLASFEFGLFSALGWYWSGFAWSPFGSETCGLEFLLILIYAYPAFALGMLIRLGLLYRWKFPHPVWSGPLLLCGIASGAVTKSLLMGIFCLAAMAALPVIDFLTFRRAAPRREA